MFPYNLPSYITGATFPTLGSSWDPIGPYIGANLAAIAAWSPGTMPGALQMAQSQSLNFTMNMLLANSFGTNVYSNILGLQGSILAQGCPWLCGM